MNEINFGGRNIKNASVSAHDLAGLPLIIPAPKVTLLRRDHPDVPEIGISYEQTSTQEWLATSRVWLFAERAERGKSGGKRQKRRRFVHPPHYTRYYDGTNGTPFWGGAGPRGAGPGGPVSVLKTYHTEFRFEVHDERLTRKPRPYEICLLNAFNVFEFYWLLEEARIPTKEDFPINCIPWADSGSGNGKRRKFPIVCPRMGNKKRTALSLSFYFCFAVTNPDTTAKHPYLFGPPSQTIKCRPIFQPWPDPFSPPPDGNPPAGVAPYRQLSKFQFTF